jgi:uncharacterized protein (TIGR00251 family)
VTRGGEAALDVRESDGGVSLRVRVQPRASSDGIGGERNGALAVRLTAPPVEGAANEALTRLLARALGVPPGAVRVLRGQTGREKIVHVRGVSAADVLALAGTPAERNAR